MDFKKHMAVAWELTLEFIAPLILLTLVMFILWFFSFGILMPVTFAGYTQSILLMSRQGREPKIQDLFSQLNLFLPLLGFSIIICIAAVTGFVFFVFPGILVTFIVVFVCFFMIPLMTDQKLGLMAAIKKSYALAMKGALLDHLVAVIVFIGISVIGSSVFIGSLFTQPLATVFLITVYEEKI